MTTLAAGSVATLYLPLAQTLTFTPGTGGRISLNGRNVDGSAITPQEMYTATSVAFRAGATVSVEAINVDCTYTDVSDSLVPGTSAAPATLDATTAAALNGKSVDIASGATMTVGDTAWAALSGGLVINVGQSGPATLAFSGTATKENSSGTSATSVTLAASGVYALMQSPTGSPKFRLSGGATL